MKFKRLLVPFVAAFMLASMMPAVVSADEVEQGNDTAIVEVADVKSAEKVAKASKASPGPKSGSCGGNITWSLDDAGKLTISGSGKMYNNSGEGGRFNGWDSEIKSVVISGKITYIGAYTFQNCTKLTSVSIPASVTSIGSCAFIGCTSLKKVSGGKNLTSIGSYAFKGCTSLSSFTISSAKLKKIGAYCFKGDTKLKTIKIANTTKITKKGVKNSLKSSKVTTVDVKNAKKIIYGAYFAKSNSGKKVTVK